MIDLDGYDERMNPYFGTCPKHGAWKGTYDECPKCMKESFEKEEQMIPHSICWNCVFGSEPDSKVYCTYNPKLDKLGQVPRKKYCKHYKEYDPRVEDYSDPRDDGTFEMYEKENDTNDEL